MNPLQIERLAADRVADHHRVARAARPSHIDADRPSMPPRRAPLRWGVANLVARLRVVVRLGHAVVLVG